MARKKKVTGSGLLSSVEEERSGNAITNSNVSSDSNSGRKQKTVSGSDLLSAVEQERQPSRKNEQPTSVGTTSTSKKGVISKTGKSFGDNPTAGGLASKQLGLTKRSGRLGVLARQTAGGPASKNDLTYSRTMQDYAREAREYEQAYQEYEDYLSKYSDYYSRESTQKRLDTARRQLQSANNDSNTDTLRSAINAETSRLASLDAADEQERLLGLDLSKAKERLDAKKRQQGEQLKRYVKEHGYAGNVSYRDLDSALDDEVQQLQAEYDQAYNLQWRRDQGNKYNALRQNADYAGNTGYRPELARRDTAYATINGEQQRRQGNSGKGITLIDNEDKYGYLSDDERSTYNYLYNTQGYQAAEDYLDYLSYDLNERRQSAKYKATSNFAGKNAGTGIISSALSVPANLASGIGAIDIGIQRAANAESGLPVDFNSAWQDPYYYTNTVRSTISNNLDTKYGTLSDSIPVIGGQGLGFLYQTGMSMADSAAIAALSYSTGIPEMAGTSLLGGSAAVSSMHDAHNKGLSDGQALATGVMAGIAETLFEEVSLEKLLKPATLTGGTTATQVKNLLKQTAAQAGVEASEEFFTTAANLMTDLLINGDQSDILTTYQNYLNQGMSGAEAGARTFGDELSGALQDALAGAISGGVMGGAKMGAAVVANNLNNSDAATGRRVVRSGTVQQVLDMAQQLGTDASLYEQVSKQIQEADAAQAQQSEGATAQPKYNVQTVGQLANAVQAQPQTEAIQSRLAALGESEDTAELSEAIYKKANARKMTRQQEQLLSGSENGQQVVYELTAAIRGEQGSEWASDAVNASRAVSQYQRKATSETNSAIRDAVVNRNVGLAAKSAGQVSVADGEQAATVTGIKRTSKENGGVSVIVKDESGNVSTVSLNDLTRLPASTSALIQQALHYPGSAANVMFASYTDGQTVGEYSRAWAAGWEAGINGLDVPTGYEGFSKAVQMAYETAQSMKQQEAARKDIATGRKANADQEERIARTSKRAKAVSAKAIKSGTVSYDGGTLTSNGVEYTLPAVQRHNMTDYQKQAASAIERLVKAGVADSVVFFASDVNSGTPLPFNGAYLNNTLYIDLNAGKFTSDDTRQMVMQTFGHELTHTLESTDAYADLKRFVLEHIGEEKLVEIRQRLEDTGLYSESDFEAETVANACAEVLFDSQAVRAMAKENRTLFERVRDFVRDLIQNIRDIYKQENSFRQESILMRDVADQLAEFWDTALIEKVDTKNKASQESPSAEFSMRSPVEESHDLLALHNLTEENLRDVLKLGGFPMPSIAVVKADQGHSKYGPISLVLPKASIDPEADSRNHIYGADAYTPTAPAVEYPVNYDRLVDIEQTLNNLAEGIANGIFSNSSLIRSLGIDDTSDMSAEQLAERLAGKDTVRAAYLADQGKTLEPIISDKVWNKYGNDALKTLIDQIGFQRLAEINANLDTGMQSEEALGTDAEKIRSILREYYRKSGEGMLQRVAKRNGWSQDEIEEKRQDRINRSMENNVSPFTLEQFARDAWSLYQDGGKTKGEIDRMATHDKLMDETDRKQVQDWLRGKLDGLMGEPGIYNGKERFTPSGNSRSFSQLHYAYTAENIVRAMTETQSQRGEKVFVPNSTGLMSTATPEYSSISDVKQDSGRLQTVDDQEYKELLDEIDDSIGDVITKVRQQNKPHSDNSFEENDIIGSILVSSAAGKHTPAAIIRAFAKEGYTIDKDTARMVQALYHSAAQMPTGYFEAKPERVVQYDEALAVVVPDNMDSGLMDQIEAAGMPVRAYAAGDEQSRLEAINSVEGAKFSARDSEGRDLSPEQQKYFSGSVIRDEDGNLLVMYHGRVSQFTVFDRAFSNPEGDMGAGFYFTNQIEDAENNYGSRDGADLSQKIDLLAEQLYDNDEYDSYEDAREAAAERYITAEPNTLQTYLNVTNPVVLGGVNETQFTYEESYDEETDEYGEPEGLMADFMQALQDVVADGAFSEDTVDVTPLIDLAYEDPTAEEVIKKTKEEVITYLEDEEGRLVSSEVIRLALEQMGFDGIIDHTVSYKWGTDSDRAQPMTGVDSDTFHCIVFNSNQIKLTDNQSPTTNPDIRFSVRDTDDGKKGALGRNYSYAELISHEPVQVVQIQATQATDRDAIVEAGLQNALENSSKTDRNGAPMVYVKDLGKSVTVGRHALRHGLDRRIAKQADAVANIGTILKNSIVVNEADPKKANMANSFITIGVAELDNGNRLYVRCVINQSTGHVEDVTSLYAAYAKTEAPASTQRMVKGKPYRMPSASTINVAELLEAVKNKFSDSLSDDVVKQMGVERKTSEITERLRYSARDSEGRELSDGQKKYFADSVVRDEDGNLLVMYHGTPKGGFTQFRNWSYMTANRPYAERYADHNSKNAAVYETYVNMTRPFDTRIPEIREIWENEFFDNYSRTPLQDTGLPDWTDGYDLAEFIEENGYDYDGILLDEGADPGVNGEIVERGISYVVRSSEQIKRTDNKNPTSDPDIRYSSRIYEQTDDEILSDLDTASLRTQAEREAYFRWERRRAQYQVWQAKVDELRQQYDAVTDKNSQEAKNLASRIEHFMPQIERAMQQAEESRDKSRALQDVLFRARTDALVKDARGALGASQQKALVALRNEATALRRRLAEMQRQSTVTTAETAQANQAEIKRMAEQLTSGTSVSSKDVMYELSNLVTALMKSGTVGGEALSWNEVYQLANNVADQITSGYQLDFSQIDDRFDDIIGKTMTVPKSIRADLRALGLDVRAKNAGLQLKYTDDATSDLEDFVAHTPGVADSSDSLPAQLDTIVSTIEGYRQTALEQIDIAQETEALAQAILDGAMDVAQQHTQADRELEKQQKAAERAQERVDATKQREQAKAADRLERQKSRYEERLEAAKQKLADTKQAMREAATARVQEARKKQRARDMAERAQQNADRRERAEASGLRGRIVRHAAALSRKLLQPSDTQHIPEQLRTSVAAVLDAIDLTSKKNIESDADLTKRTKAFLAAKEAYQAILKENNGEIVFDPSLLDASGGLLDQLIKMRNVPIASMNSQQLTIVWNTLKAIENSISTAGKTLSKAKYERISDWAERYQADTVGRKQKRSITKRHYMIDMETPLTFFSHFGEAGDATYRMLRNAQDRQQVMTDEITEAVQKVLGEKPAKTIADLQRDVKQFTTEAGETLVLSADQRMEIYLLSQREQAKEHLLIGGIVQPEVRDGRKTIRRGTKATHLTAIDLSKITGSLTEQQVKTAEAMRDIVTSKLSAWGNKASETAYGYKKFRERNYWPIRTAAEETHSDIEQSGKMDNAQAVRNFGMTKSTVPHANNGVDISGMSATFARHAQQMITYAAWLCPMEDVSRLYNWKYSFKAEDGTSQTADTLKGTLDRVGGSGAADYWQNLMADIQSGIGSSMDSAMGSIPAKLLGNAKGAAVGANIRVVLQQPTAFFRALAVWNASDLMRGFSGGGFKSAAEHSPIAARKASGGFDISSGRQMSDTLYGTTSKLQKLNEALSWGAGKADEITWGYLWNCAVNKVQREGKFTVGSDEFYAEASRQFTEMIDATQVVDGVLQRSQIMRSSSAWNKMATSFMGEPTMSFNLMMRAVDHWAYETNSTKKRAAAKKIVRGGFALLFTAAVNGVVKSFVDAWRDDDKDKSYWQRFVAALSGVDGTEENAFGKIFNIFFGGNILSDVNPLQQLPYVKDIISILQGYAVGRMDMDAVSDLVSCAQNLLSALNGDNKRTVAYTMEQFASQLGKLAGVSAGNIGRDAWGIIRSIVLEKQDYWAEYQMEQAIYSLSYDGNKNQYMNILQRAYLNDYDTFEEISTDMIDRGIYTEEDINNVLWNWLKGSVEASDDLDSYNELVQQFIETGVVEQETAENYITKYRLLLENPNFSGEISTSQAEKFEVQVKPSGISLDTYYEFIQFYATAESDKDSNGDTIDGRSKKDKVMAYINSQSLSKSQKDALFLCYYKESKLDDTPWH